jgi:tungstate transport system permease protein
VSTAELTLRTLRIGLEATLIAAVPGLPPGVALGLGRFRGRRIGLGIANAGLRLPPVALGHALWLLMWPSSVWGGGPLAGLGWLYTVKATILAQALLALPLIVALTAAAVQAVPVELLDQARAFGARRVGLAALAAREARLGVLAAVIAAIGTATASVGAVLVVGALQDGPTLPAAAVVAWGASDHAHAAAYGAVAMGLFLAVAAALTAVQHGEGRGARWQAART